MSKFVSVILGGLEVAAGVIVGVTIGWTGAAMVMAYGLIAQGAGLLISGAGTLISSAAGGSAATGTTGGGITVASRNPIAPWQVVYGACAVSGRAVRIDGPPTA
jgi:hypothetical protein